MFVLEDEDRRRKAPFPQRQQNPFNFGAPVPATPQKPFVFEGAAPAPPQPQLQQQPQPSQRLFSEEQVRQIVKEALAKREEEIRLEFYAILQDKLKEQFEMFSTFNRDQVTRQLRRSDADYFS